jgi:hypothetical protein
LRARLPKKRHLRQRGTELRGAYPVAASGMHVCGAFR